MTGLLTRVNDGIGSLVRKLHSMQAGDGSWRLGFIEDGTTTDAAAVMMFQTVFPGKRELVRRLCERLTACQHPDGSWRVFPDERDGNLSATSECYYALLTAGFDFADPAVARAAKALDELGGIRKIDSLLTKFLLAVIGRYPWPKWFPVPITLMMLPTSGPIHFFQFSGYARVHMAPMLLLGDKKHVVRTPLTSGSAQPDTSPRHPFTPEDAEWARHFDGSLAGAVNKMLKSLGKLPGSIHEQAVQRTVQYMLDRLEPDGTLYSYATSSVLMIHALRAAGFPSDHPVIVKAGEGLETFLCPDGQLTTLQNTTSTVWDTALISHALGKAGLPSSRPALQKAGRYLLERQHDKAGDWALRVDNPVPGGWGFSNINTINPDIDDTTAALRAISRLRTEPAFEASHNRGLQWLLAMQNDDGGWAAFERNCDSLLLKWLPLDGAEDAAIDPSSADLTGRALEYLGSTLGLTNRLPFIRRAVDWLYLHQELSGSWYGRWGVCYIYGTWAAVTGLIAVGENPSHPQLRQAAEWLLHIQHDDGGFGESCISDREKRFTQLAYSTLTQTAWALDALVALHQSPIEPMERAADYILRHLDTQGPAAGYPTGAGLPGHLYIRYESYPVVWPLLALANYRNKYQLM